MKTSLEHISEHLESVAGAVESHLYRSYDMSDDADDEITQGHDEYIDMIVDLLLSAIDRAKELGGQKGVGLAMREYADIRYMATNMEPSTEYSEEYDSPEYLEGAVIAFNEVSGLINGPNEKPKVETLLARF